MVVAAAPAALSALYGELLDDMHATLDERDITVILKEAEQILADEMVFIPLYPSPAADLITPDHLYIPDGQIKWTEGSWMEALWYSLDPNDELRSEP